MKKVPMMSWGDRFAIIDAYNPSKVSICKAFNLSMGELDTANKLRSVGTFAPNNKLDVTKFADIFPNISDDEVTQPLPPTKVGTATFHTRPETATKKIVNKTPQKRGRKGNKISSALFAVTSTPVPVEQFAREHNVSLTVLRQSKRFTEKMTESELREIGKITVRQDQTTKVLMIWREDL